VGGRSKVMVVKSYRTSCDAPHHPIRDQRNRSSKHGNRGERESVVTDNHLRVEPGAQDNKKKKGRNELEYNPIDMLPEGLPDVIQTA